MPKHNMTVSLTACEQCGITLTIAQRDLSIDQALTLLHRFKRYKTISHFKIEGEMMTEQADYKTIIENEKLRLWEEGYSDEEIEQILEERG